MKKQTVRVKRPCAWCGTMTDHNQGCCSVDCYRLHINRDRKQRGFPPKYRPVEQQPEGK